MRITFLPHRRHQTANPSYSDGSQLSNPVQPNSTFCQSLILTPSGLSSMQAVHHIGDKYRRGSGLIASAPSSWRSAASAFQLLLGHQVSPLAHAVEVSLSDAVRRRGSSVGEATS